jgi:hypothetical protein
VAGTTAVPAATTAGTGPSVSGTTAASTTGPSVSVATVSTGTGSTISVTTQGTYFHNSWIEKSYRPLHWNN